MGETDTILRQLDALPGHGDWNYLGPEAHGGAVHSVNGGPIIAAPPDGEMTTEWDMVAEFIARAPRVIRALLDTDERDAIVADLAAYQYAHILDVFDARVHLYCVICEGVWFRGEPEWHEPDCLAMRARAIVARQGVGT